ncbi:MAG: FecR family protein [Bacteroidales bacterium]
MIDEESMDLLLLKYFKGDISKKEKELIDKWLNEDSKNKTFFDQAARIWEAMEITPSLECDYNKAWNIHLSKRKANKSSFWNQSFFIRVAAIFLFLLALSSVIFFVKNRSTQIKIYASNKSREIFLPDSTKVTLNKGSELSYAQNYNYRKNRYVHLDGEAFFEVNHNPQKPFIVKTNCVEVKVLGTQFNLNSISNNKIIDLNVFEGRVSFKDLQSRNIIIVDKGQKVHFDRESRIFSKPSLLEENSISWKTGELVFRNQSLQVVFNDLEKYFDRKIILKDKALGKMKISARFYESESIEEIVKSISIALDIPLKLKDNCITVEN